MPSGSLLTPIGRVTVATRADRLARVQIGVGDETDEAPDALVAEAIAQLRAWFAGHTAGFDLPLEPARTPRGENLRDAIAAVRSGATASYGAVARMAGSSPRAVGQACARNPFPIVIPCHRIVGAGDLIGHYSAGQGVATKRWLLAHEEGLSRG